LQDQIQKEGTVAGRELEAQRREQRNRTLPGLPIVK
jgi:hypothetical protein